MMTSATSFARRPRPRRRRRLSAEKPPPAGMTTRLVPTLKRWVWPMPSHSVCVACADCPQYSLHSGGSTRRRRTTTHLRPPVLLSRSVCSITWFQSTHSHISYFMFQPAQRKKSSATPKAKVSFLCVVRCRFLIDDSCHPSRSARKATRNQTQLTSLRFAQQSFYCLLSLMKCYRMRTASTAVAAAASLTGAARAAAAGRMEQMRTAAPRAMSSMRTTIRPPLPRVHVHAHMTSARSAPSPLVSSAGRYLLLLKRCDDVILSAVEFVVFFLLFCLLMSERAHQSPTCTRAHHVMQVRSPIASESRRQLRTNNPRPNYRALAAAEPLPSLEELRRVRKQPGPSSPAKPSSEPHSTAPAPAPAATVTAAANAPAPPPFDLGVHEDRTPPPATGKVRIRIKRNR